MCSRRKSGDDAAFETRSAAFDTRSEAKRTAITAENFGALEH